MSVFRHLNSLKQISLSLRACVSSPINFTKPQRTIRFLRKLNSQNNHNYRYVSSFGRLTARTSEAAKLGGTARGDDRRAYTALWLLAAPFFASKTSDEPDGEIVKTIKRAMVCMQRDDLRRAERLLHLALRLAQEQQHQDGISYIYSLLADCAVKQRHLRRAEKLLTELSRRLAATDGTDSNSFVEVSMKLASIYAALEDRERADAGYQYCIDTQRSKIDAVGDDRVDEDTLALWGVANDWYARVLSMRGEHARARELARRALDVSVHISGETGEQSLVLLSDLGTFEAQCGDLGRAVELLSRAVELGKQQQHEDLAAFHVNLGLVLMRQGLLVEAERECSIGANMAKGKLEPDEVTVAEAAQCLTRVKRLLAENKAAEQRLEHKLGVKA